MYIYIYIELVLRRYRMFSTISYRVELSISLTNYYHYFYYYYNYYEGSENNLT